MKILVTNAYAPENKGDAAILSVLLTQLKKAFPSSAITISIFNETARESSFDGYPLVPNLMYVILFYFKNTLLKFVFTIYLILSSLLWAFVYRFSQLNLIFLIPKIAREELNKILESNLIVPIGGGYLRTKQGHSGLANLYLTLHPIILALILKKPVVMYSQSIGPFENNFDKFLTKTVLNQTRLIMVREDKSIKTLDGMGVKKEIVLRTVDAGFIFDSNSHIKLENLVKKKIHQKTDLMIGVTVRKWLSSNKQAAFEKSVAEFIDQLISRNPKVAVVFIPQVSSTLHADDDRTVASNIIQHIHHQNRVVNLDDSFTHHQLKRLYSELDFLVGTRFHSVIFALTSHVPSLAIEYEYKTGGIMKDLKLSDWVIPIEEVTSKKLNDLFLNLVRQKKHYQNTLASTLPEYILKANQNTEFLKEAYYENQ
jgi:colanic acid/amylovoran biosynthesis protein